MLASSGGLVDVRISWLCGCAKMIQLGTYCSCVEHSLALQFQIIRALLAVSTKEEGIPCDAVSLAAVDRQDIFE